MLLRSKHMKISKVQQQVIEENIAKTMAEIAAAENPRQDSRTWTHPEGYKYLVQWKKITAAIPDLIGNPYKYFYRFRVKHGMTPPSLQGGVADAARSVVRNIEERDATQDKFLNSHPGSSLASIGIDLKSFNSSMHPLKEFSRRFNLRSFPGTH